MIFLRENILKKRFASPGVQPPFPQLARAFRWADPFGPQYWPIFAPKSLFNFSGGVPGPSLAQNPHFFPSLGRLRERSRRKQESSKYTVFYSLILQGYIPWPLQGAPPGAKKKRNHRSWSPQGLKGATTRLPGSPQGPPGRENHRF